MSWKYIDTSILEDVEIFSQLGERGRQEIIVLMSTMNVKQGQAVFVEGEPGDALYVILSGEVRISKNIPGVGEEALAFLPEGSCFGEMALIEDRIMRSASAFAHRDCELAMLSRKDFWKLMDDEKDLAVDILWSFVRVLSSRLRNSNDKVAFMAMSSKFE